MRPHPSPSVFGGLARDLQASPDERERMRLGVQRAVNLVAGCDHASITVAGRRQLMTVAASDSLVEQGDVLQYEYDEGPCVDALRSSTTVLSQDLAQEERWRRWAPDVVERLGIRSTLSIPLQTSEQAYGSLNLYATRAEVYSAEDAATAEAIAALLAVAVTAKREIEQRSLAMVSRTTIGQAQGLLMERLGLDGDQAFGYLRRISQQQNRKLVDVARDLLETRQLPEAPLSAAG